MALTLLTLAFLCLCSSASLLVACRVGASRPGVPRLGDRGPTLSTPDPAISRTNDASNTNTLASLICNGGYCKRDKDCKWLACNVGYHEQRQEDFT